MTTEEAHRYCTTRTKQSGSNFYYSFLFLPRERREAMYTIYTLCHEVDDAVDHPPSGSDPHEQITAWRNEIRATYADTPRYPVTISLAEHVRRLDIPEEYFQELLTGMEMDLTTKRYPTFEALYPYCYRVASIVGLICLKVFGTQAPQAREYAVHLGMAFQLTNILRDIGADADRDRIYLPAEDLIRFGYSEDDILKKRYSTEFLNLMQFECSRAREYYRKAQTVFASLPAADRKSLLAAEIMRAIYYRILVAIESAQYRVYGPRIRLSPAHRLALALGTWIGSLFQSAARLRS